MKQRYLFLMLFLFSGNLLKAHSEYTSIEFIENKGQWDAPFLFKATTSFSNIYLEKSGFTYVLGARDNHIKIHDLKRNILKAPQTLNYHAYKVIFEGAAPLEDGVGSKAQRHYYNYFLGNDPAKWKTDIHPYYNVDYRSMYPGIDLHVASDKGQLKYDFIVQPGADAEQIKLRYEGTDGLYLKNDDLHIKTSLGEVEELKPYAYQYINGVKKTVRCLYKIKGSTVSYFFPDGYDKTKVLVIDPVVRFATFTGSTDDNWGFTATYDKQGNLYAGGITGGTSGSSGYPTVPGSYKTTHSGGGTADGNSGAILSDMTITKFDASGGSLIYSTYIGGTENDQPHSMIVDGSGNLIIAGRTYSNDFPMQGAYDNTHNGGADIVVLKLNAAGNALLGSTYFGGVNDDGVNISSIWGTTNASLKHSYADDSRSEVIIDNSGNIYVASSTKSPGLSAPVVGSLSSTQDGLVLKFNSSLSNLIWGTYIGGTGDDAAYVLALNKAQTQLYVAGGMTASGLPPAATTGTLNATYRGGAADGFIARFVNSGTHAMDRATYIGTSAYDQCFGIQVDVDNNVYVMGQTLGSYPVQPAPTSPTIYSNAGSPQFITKLDKDLAGIIYSTRFGSPNTNTNTNISPVAFLVDTCQNVYISGWGGAVAGNNSSTANMPVDITTNPVISNPATISSTTDGSDFYFIALSKNAIALLFAGYYGSQSIPEHVDGGTSRFDENGVIYQAICGGCGASSSLPTTTGAFSQTNGSQNCNLAAIKIEFNLGAVKAQAEAKPNTAVCLGESIQFENNSTNATQFEWDFGDGSPGSTQKVPAPHTYTTIGTFDVRMIAINPNACKVRDTVNLKIKVDTNKIYPDFTVSLIDSCNPYLAQVTNTSTYSKTPGAQNFTIFTWDFGDGKTATGANPGPHTYSDTGTYTIKLTMVDTSACNSPDTITRKIHFTNILVKAEMEFPEICQGQDAQFTSKTTNATGFKWDFGDGDTSNLASPLHSYDKPGEYKIKFYAFNPASCNKVDSVESLLTVKPSPIADFEYSPKKPDPLRNVPITFTNKSENAIAYQWNFGDNTGSDEKDPIHLYKKSGNYTVCLIARNDLGCVDTICRTVETEILPLVDLPTGFSPNGDGKNDILYVRGAGVEKFNLKIFNRWGQLVFEVIDGQANDPKFGWDGKFNGEEQEMEAYAFVLMGTYTDETTFYMKGNVTLLR